MAEKIQGNTPIFNIATIKSVNAVVAKGATAPANNTVLPIGWPVASKGDGTYEIFTKEALGTVLKGASSTCPRPLGILMESVKVAASMTAEIKVAYAGEFYLDGMREATGITATDMKDFIFMEAAGHLVATKINDKQMYALANN